MMNWGLWISIVCGVSITFVIISFPAFLAYHQGHQDGYKKGLNDKQEIEEKYKR